MAKRSVDSDVDDDDDGRSSIASNDSFSETMQHDHRLCSRHGPCNKDKHSKIARCLSSSSDIPMKGDLRPMDDKSEYQQKFDGRRWRRICSMPNCLRYLSGHIYHETWLCQEHYQLRLISDSSNNSENNPRLINGWQDIFLSNRRDPSNRRIGKQIYNNRRGEIATLADGTREKYTGEQWRRVCLKPDCSYFAVRRGFCRRHNIETQKEQQETSPSPSPVQPQSPKPPSEISELPIVQSLPLPTIVVPEIGDIQMVRQRWNGKKWYTLCHYATGDCMGRSAGPKCGFLCHTHFKEYKRQQRNSTNQTDENEYVPSSPIIKRRKRLNGEIVLSSDTADGQQSIVSDRSETDIDRINPIDQSAQTDFTCQPNSIGLNQGFMLIDDDSNENQSHPFMFLIKREGGYTFDSHAISLNTSNHSQKYPTVNTHSPISIDFKRETVKCHY